MQSLGCSAEVVSVSALSCFCSVLFSVLGTLSPLSPKMSLKRALALGRLASPSASASSKNTRSV